MTRKTWLKGLITSLVPLALLGAKKPDIWSTPQGQYVLALRDELKRLGYWDDLSEDWQDTVDALNKGHKLFHLRGSREVWSGDRKKIIYSIKPTTFKEKITYVSAEKMRSTKIVPCDYLEF